MKRLADLVQFSQDRIQSMQVTVPVSGVLAPLDIPLQEGQWVQSGQALSRVVRSRPPESGNPHTPDAGARYRRRTGCDDRHPHGHD